MERPSRRAAHYQEQAENLRDMAEAEPRRALRDQLLALAAQYHETAAELLRTTPITPLAG